MNLNKIIGPLLGVLVLAGVVGAIWYSATDKASSDNLAARFTQRIVVRVVSGSEKLNLLHDERLTRLLEKKGISLEVQKAGSREIAGLADLRTYDVAFPAGQPAAEKIRTSTAVKRTATAFSTPMVVASWKPIVDVLANAGIVRVEGGVYWITDMNRLLELMASGKRWRDLPGNTAFPVGKSILISTTNVSTSNSAAQFLALASYLFNNAEVVTSYEQGDAAARRVAPLFARQGFQEASSSGPFEDYLSIGMGKTPLVWIYEAQFLEQALQRQIKPGMVLLYPRPTVFTKHVMVALSEKGTRFLDAMADPEALRIAAEYGYRSEGAGSAEKIKAEAKGKGLLLPDLVDLVDPPSFDMLEHMILAIERERDAAGPGEPARLAAPQPRPQLPAPQISSKEKAR
ncbi:MAG TPA: hypothetical protein VKE95_15490 [Burkholderiales bacterium]|nr:hypothetical protein [Burkholderiales bacterium]